MRPPPLATSSEDALREGVDGGCLLRLEDVEHLVALSQRCPLEHLDLSGCALTTDHARALCDMDWRRVRRFKANMNNFGVEGVLLLAGAAAGAPELRYFDVFNSGTPADLVRPLLPPGCECWV